MPVDFEMLLSVSPPLYAYSAFADCRFSHYHQTDQVFQSGNDFEQSKRNYINSQKLQHCMRYSDYRDVRDDCERNKVTWTIGDSSVEETYEDESLTKCKSEKKKRVSFADDKGLSLVDIRLIPENTDSIPSEPDNILSLLTAGVKPGVTSEKKWKQSFEHPPFESDVLQGKLNQNLICLESVRFAEDNNEILTGTIKVKNIAFEKDVFLRFTFDRWVSHTDVSASYVPVEARDEMSEKYDTFTFAVEIPHSAFRYQVVEFCACLKSNGMEHWDNNGGINYRLVATQSDMRSIGTVPTRPQRKNNVFSPTEVQNFDLGIEGGYGVGGWRNYHKEVHFW